MNIFVLQSIFTFPYLPLSRQLFQEFKLLQVAVPWSIEPLLIWKDVSGGTPQGYLASLLLHNIFINYLNVCLLHSQMMLNLYAVEAKIKIPSDPDHLKCLK